MKLSCCKKVTLPTGHAGLSFAGQPPQINGVKDGSALTGMVNEGEYIVGLVVPSVIEMYGFNQSELGYLLRRYSDIDGRMLLVGKAPASDGGKKAMLTLPSGPIGVTFSGCPPEVTKVRDESPLSGLIAVGQVVIGFQIPTKLDFSADIETSELVSMLKANQDRDDRILIMSNEPEPSPSAPRAAEEDTIVPPSNVAKPGGEWYTQEYRGGNTALATVCGILLCGLPGLIAMCMTLDERYVYQEPDDGHRFSVKGKVVGKGGKALVPLPKGTVVPIKAKNKGKEPPAIVVSGNASAVHPIIINQ
mmetsp:Transcript_17126/g.49147  ORF Transcript_17126/g.49147 Transcript_17126/m.49147 type:complete len:304 (+) Transcript_17126:332-1243(+)|eukprot:CAMPEP_0181058606 /NCGR_PEP_ID=MMETSP1070-20121207/20909_1 /TAXON_ID=265543 /ORGANISM="Minutocellus polymorphus, Strain NH13" /LENGTH=303 /DNA_ID=CAMNT_0023138169 /DNA_START=326 /DNA_END=1237 /DNA_ORIENTATION=-